MTASEIARAAVRDTAASAPFVSPDVRERLAIAAVAIVIDGMDDSISPAVRLMRLSDAIATVREILHL